MIFGYSFRIVWFYAQLPASVLLWLYLRFHYNLKAKQQTLLKLFYF